MTKKRFFIILGIIIILILGFLVTTFFITNKENPDSTSGISIGGFFPFGQPTQRQGNGDNGANNGNGSSVSPGPIISVPFQPLVQLSSTPTAGMYVFKRNNDTIVQYMEQSTGHVYEVNLKDLIKAKISQSTMTRIHEAWWIDGGNSILARYLRDDGRTIATFSIKTPKLGATVSTSTGGGEALFPDNILDFILTKDGKKIFTLAPNSDNSDEELGFAGDASGYRVKNVFDSKFTEWLPVSFDGKTVWLQTKASQEIAGHLYRLDTSTGALLKVVGGINGLTALPSPDGKYILYSESTLGLFKTYLYDVTKAQKADFPATTLPEKCAWKGSDTLYCLTPDNPKTANYPDEWYQGLISFNDKLWKIDAKTLEATMLYDIVGEKKMIDGTRPMVLDDGSVFLFLNKKDSTLWAYRESPVE